MKKTETDYLMDTVRAWLSTETPRTQKELEALTGIDKRDVRRLIGLLRDRGVKICSGPSGFWIWDGKDASWSMTQRTMRRKAISMLIRAHRMGAVALEGQMTIEELLGEVSA